MSNWRKVEKSIISYNKGITPKYVKSSNIIVLNQKCIRNNVIDYSLARFCNENMRIKESAFIQEGDILICSTGQGTAGRCSFVEKLPQGKQIVIDSHILKLQCNSFFEAKCLSYSLYSVESLLQTYIDGSTGQGEFDRIRLFNLLINFSSNNNTQKNISFILSSLDKKIELNNKINAELEAMAKTIYDYWFVQFEFPNEEGKPYKSSGGKMVYDEDLKREIPEGWEVKKIGDYSQVKGGFAFKSNWWTKKGAQVIKITNILENQTIDLLGCSFVSLDKLKVASKFVAHAGDVVIAMTGATVGKFAFVPHSNMPILVNQRVGLFDLGNKPINQLPFLINSLKQKYFREAIFTIASGAAQPNISHEQINNIPLLIPHTSFLIEKYNARVKNVYTKIILNQKENQELTSLRDCLLPMLMNGQVGFKEESKTDVVENKNASLQSAILAGHIINQNKNNDFGRVKLMKLLYLSEHICELNFGSNYIRETAGPYDCDLVSNAEELLKRYSIFSSSKECTKRGNDIVKYTPLAGAFQITGMFKDQFGDKAQHIESLLTKLNKLPWQTCEIMATLYAVWNNRIIKNLTISDNILVDDFYDWSTNKQKYTVEDITNALEYMRREKIIPVGRGKYIE